MSRKKNSVCVLLFDDPDSGLAVRSSLQFEGTLQGRQVRQAVQERLRDHNPDTVTILWQDKHLSSPTTATAHMHRSLPGFLVRTPVHQGHFHTSQQRTSLGSRVAASPHSSTSSLNRTTHSGEFQSSSYPSAPRTPIADMAITPVSPEPRLSWPVTPVNPPGEPESTPTPLTAKYIRFEGLGGNEEDEEDEGSVKIYHSLDSLSFCDPEPRDHQMVLLSDEDTWQCEAGKRALRLRLSVSIERGDVAAALPPDPLTQEGLEQPDSLPAGSEQGGVGEEEENWTTRYLHYAIKETEHCPHPLRHSPTRTSFEHNKTQALINKLKDLSVAVDRSEEWSAEATRVSRQLMDTILEEETTSLADQALHTDILKVISVCMKQHMGDIEYLTLSCRVIRLLCAHALDSLVTSEIDSNLGGTPTSDFSQASPSANVLHLVGEDTRPKVLKDMDPDEVPIQLNEPIYACLILLKHHATNPSLVMLAANALKSMLWFDGFILQKNITLLIAYGGVDPLLTAFHGIDSDPDAIAAVTNVLQLIASNEDAWQDLQRWTEVVRVSVLRLRAFPEHLTLQKPLIWCLAYMTCHSGMQQHVVECGVMDAVLGCMLVHPYDAPLVHAVFQLFVNLTFYDGSAEHAAKFVSSRLSEIHQAMQQHETNLQVQTTGCGLLRNIAIELRKDVPVFANLAEAGVAEDVIAAVKRFVDQRRLLEHAFSFLWTYCVTCPLDEGDALGIVFRSLRIHSMSYRVQKQVLGFLRTLLARAVVLRPSSGIQQQFIASNGLKFVFHAMHFFDKMSDITVHCLRILFGLSKVDKNRIFLLKQGCLEAVFEALQDWPHDEAIQNWGLSVFWNVGTTGSVSEDGKSELMRLGALPVIVNAMRNHPTDYDIQQDCVNILLNMSHGRYGISQMNQLEVGSLTRRARSQHPRLKKAATHLLHNLEESDCRAM